MRNGIDMDKSGGRNENQRKILMNLDRMAQLAESWYTVAIRKIKDGVIITSHKERVVK